MFKRTLWLLTAAILCVSYWIGGSAYAAELDEATRTVRLNEQGDTLVLSLQQVSNGKQQFNYACGQCHIGGVTKTNPSVGLSPDTLAGAFPARDNVEALVDYMHNPTTYDGLVEIEELHPSTRSTDVFPKMRSLTEDDLVAIAGHILVQPNIIGDMWGAGKTRFSAP